MKLEGQHSAKRALHDERDVEPADREHVLAWHAVRDVIMTNSTLTWAMPMHCKFHSSSLHLLLAVGSMLPVLFLYLGYYAKLNLFLFFE